VLGGSFNFLFNGIIAVSPGGSIPVSGAKVFRPKDYSGVGTQRKHFASGSLGIIMSGTTPISTPLMLDLCVIISEVSPKAHMMLKAWLLACGTTGR
jgi:hypothetical protein